jgi:hypothetical protein
MAEPIRVFIGGGVEHWLPATVLEYSIRRHSAPYKVLVYHLLDCEVKVPIPKPRDARNHGATSFSFQRFIAPEWCDFQGKSIYLDSDMIVQACICELWHTPIPQGASAINTGSWQSAVMLIDNTCGWRVSEFIQKLDRGEWSYGPLMNLKYPELRLQPGLNPLWNVIDRPDAKAMDVKRAKLLHFTDMGLQPWLNSRHPHCARWTNELLAAKADGVISEEEVMREIRRGHVRPSLALLFDEEPPYDDRDFVYPNSRRKVTA